MRDLHLTAGVVDLTSGRIERHDGPGTLTTTERALLRYLAMHAGRDLPRAELLTQVWGYAPTVSSRTLDTAVKVLRKKVEVDPRRPDHLLTVWGVGYRFEPLDAQADGDLVGRVGELAALDAALRGGARLSTLVGPGGVGKTRLALELARRIDGALFVDLSGATTAAHLVQAVTLAWPDPDGRPLTDRLADRARVVILDNVEHVLADVRAVALRWLDHGPGLQLVLTSRLPCGDPREQVIPIRPLPLPAATALLRRRTAQARRADVAEGDELLQRVATAMDGLPLALELAASRAAVLGMDEILLRGPRLLSDPLDEPRRHETILAVVQWSVDLLDDEARQVLSACALFRGPFAAADVQALLGPVDATDPLGRLFHASLVGHRSDGLHMLPLVRTCVQRLSAAPAPVVERYVAHVLARAERGRAEARAVAEDLRGLLEAADLPPASIARAGLLLVGVLGREAGDYPEPDIARIREAAERSGDLALRADAGALVCAAELWRGRRGRASFDEAVALARATGDPARVGWALGHLGALHRLAGDAQGAIDTLGEALLAPGLAPDRRVTLMTELGLARRAAFDLEGSLAALDAALPDANRAGDPFVQQALMHRIGGTLLQLGRFDAARVWLTRALDTAEHASLRAPAFEIRGSLAYLDLERGELDAAESGLAWCVEQRALAKGFSEGTPPRPPHELARAKRRGGVPDGNR